MNSVEPRQWTSHSIGIWSALTLFVAMLCYNRHCTRDPAPPIHFSLLLNAVVYLLATVVKCTQESYSLSGQVESRVKSLYYALFGPVALCLTIIGIHWAKINKFEHPYCNKTLGNFWLFFMLLVHLSVSTCAHERLKIWLGIDQERLLGVVPYHPNRGLDGVQGELLRVEVPEEVEGTEEDDIKGISAGLLEADLEQRGRDKKQKKGGPLRNTLREKTCSVCYVDFEMGEKVVDVPNCLHTFHEQCIADWLEKSFTCPVCRGIFRRAEHRQHEAG